MLFFVLNEFGNFFNTIEFFYNFRTIFKILLVELPIKFSSWILGTKVNNMVSRVKGLVCLWHHEHGVHIGLTTSVEGGVHEC